MLYILISLTHTHTHWMQVTGQFGSGVSTIALSQLHLWQYCIRLSEYRHTRHSQSHSHTDNDAQVATDGTLIDPHGSTYVAPVPYGAVGAAMVRELLLLPLAVVSSVRADIVSAVDIGGHGVRSFYVVTADLSSYRPIHQCHLHMQSSHSTASNASADLLMVCKSLWSVLHHCVQVGVVFKYLDVHAVMVSQKGHLQFGAFGGAVMLPSLKHTQCDFVPEGRGDKGVKSSNSGLLMPHLSYAAPEVIIGGMPSAMSTVS